MCQNGMLTRCNFSKTFSYINPGWILFGRIAFPEVIMKWPEVVELLLALNHGGCFQTHLNSSMMNAPVEISFEFSLGFGVFREHLFELPQDRTGQFVLNGLS